MPYLTAPPLPARALWLAFLIAASVGFSLGFACAVPLAAFGVLAALTLKRRQALLLLGGVWLANQVVGFGWLHYPHTAPTLAWGGILGVLALLCAVAPAIAARGMSGATAVLAGLATAFMVYEGGLFLASGFLTTETGAFAPAIVLRILAINAAAAAALFALDRVVHSRVHPPRVARPA